MYLAYMDESGNSGDKSDPEQPIHLLGCLLVEDSHVRPLEDAIREAACKHFPASGGDFEFHGVDLYNGARSCKKVPVETRLAATEDVLSATAMYAAGFGYTGIDKRRSNASDHPHRIAFSLMIEGIQPFLSQRDALGLIVADEYNEIGQTIIRDIDQFKTTGTSWGYRKVKARNIIDSVHFVKSHNNRLIQACDLVTYFTLKAIRIREAKRAEWKTLAEPRPDYWKWLPRAYSRAEQATIRLEAIAGSIMRVRAKIFP